MAAEIHSNVMLDSLLSQHGIGEVEKARLCCQDLSHQKERVSNQGALYGTRRGKC